MSEAERDGLRREARTLGRYLIGSRPSDLTVERYASPAAIARIGPPIDGFDRFLVRWAGSGAWAARSADLYSRFTRPNAALRRKLIVLLALCEVHESDVRPFHSPVSPGFLRFTAAAVARGLISTVLLAVSLPVLAVAHVVMRGRA